VLFMERPRAVVIRLRAELTAVMLRAKRDHAHVAARIGQVVNFHRARAADQARQLRDPRHVR
jgi:hypothetical protein